MPSTDQLLQNAIAFQTTGRFDEARQLFLEVLQKASEHPVALYSLAAIDLNTGNADRALAFAQRCYAANPTAALSSFILGSALKQSGRNGEALECLQRSCLLDPGHVESHLGRGVVLSALNRPREAMDAFERVLAINPNHQVARVNRDALAEPLKDATAREQQLTNTALQLQAAGEVLKAEQLFLRIIEQNPNQFAALYSLAVICLNTGRAVEGLHFAERCALAEPKSTQSWYIHGAALKALRRYSEAEVSLNRAVELDSSNLEAYVTKGHVFAEQKRYADSLVEFNNVLLRNSTHSQALNNAATLLSILSQHAESARFYSQLVQHHPEFDYALGALSHAMLHSCDWTDFHEFRKRLIEGVRAGKRICRQLAFLAVSDSPADQLACARGVSQHCYPKSTTQLWRGERYGHSKLRIGYISPDFREHPVGHLLAGVFEHHRKEEMEYHAFSLGTNDGSSLRNRFISAVDHFVEVRGKTSLEIAQIIRGAEIDVLVDLAGPTMDAQPDIFGYRPAPVQMLYLGYPGTSGADYMDYIIADRNVIPPEHHRFYSEKVLYVPGCYLPTDPKLVISERTPTREEMMIPAEGFVFCSFNHDYKINPPMFDVWMRILKRVPGSVLWLMKLHNIAEENLRKEAEKRGVDGSRLIFAVRVPSVSDHLARYRLAGLFLDTTPYNAHSTATDALRAGVPVLTLEGGSFQSRVATSVLRTIGMPELVMPTLEAYEDYAVRLAHDRSAAHQLRERVRDRVDAAFNVFIDPTEKARSLEELYQKSAVC